MKIQDKLLIIVIFLNHFYIVLLNTSSVHGLTIPDKKYFTGLLVIALAVLIYYNMKQPAKYWYEKLLYLAMFLSFAAAILRTFGISVQVTSYAIALIAISILTTTPLLAHKHNQMRIMLFGLYSLEILLLIARTFELNSIREFLGIIVEIAIVIGILYYNYSMGFAFDELFIIIIATTIGWYLGNFINNFDVPALIISTLFEQTLSLGQYTIITSITPQFFLALHVAEISNIMIVELLTGRSWRAMAIIFIGVGITYPPILFIRALLILLFLRNTMNKYENQDQEQEHPEITESNKIVKN